MVCCGGICMGREDVEGRRRWVRCGIYLSVVFSHRLSRKESYSDDVMVIVSREEST